MPPARATCYRSANLRNIENSKELKVPTASKRGELFLKESKAQRYEGEGRILLGDNTGGGAVMMQTISFHGVGKFGFWLTVSCVNTYLVDNVHALRDYRLPQQSRWELRSSEMLRSEFRTSAVLNVHTQLRFAKELPERSHWASR